MINPLGYATRRTVIRTLTSLTASAGVLLLGSGLAAAPAEASSDVVRGARAVSSTAQVTKATVTTATAASLAGGSFYSHSVWNQDISKAPIAADSALMVANLSNQTTRAAPAFNVWTYNLPIYTVPANQPRVDVKWNNCQKKSYTPAGLLGEGGQFSQVPIPDNAVTGAGNDSHITISSPGTHELWEFWKLEKKTDGWYACWGGRIDDTRSSYGYFENGYGAAATGLSLAGGAITIEDVRSGVIDHAMDLSVIKAAHFRNFSWPAQRSDGTEYGADAIPEGTRFRLDPTIDVNQIKGLSKVGKMIARAAQQYGFIVTDKGGAVAVKAESGSGVAATTGVNPWNELMAGTTSPKILKNFPWAELDALPRDYGKPSAS